MTIDQFLSLKSVTEQELRDNFEVDRIITLKDGDDRKGVCWNFQCKYSQYEFRTESWKFVQYCTQCKRFNLRYKAEPMGGGDITEKVIVFKEKGSY